LAGEQVEITNFGEGGVASEATLQSLLRAMERMSGGKSDADKAVKRFAKELNSGVDIVDDFTLSQKEATVANREATASVRELASAAGNMVLGAFGALVGVANNFKNALTSATTIGEVYEAVPIFGSVLSQATGYFQTSIDTFRSLSDVGAGFGNDMMAMRAASANAGLSLDMFAEMIGSNSDMMTFLGGTVSQGASRLGTMTKELRSTERGLMSLGYTQQTLNEGMVEYLENQALAGQLRGRSDASLIAGAQGYLEELDKLSRLTGKNRKELQEQMNQNAQAANINVIRARLSGEALQNFDNNMAHVTTMLPGLGDVFKDLSDGIPQTEIGAVLSSMVPGFKELAEANASGQLSQEQFQARLAQLAPQITSAFDSMDPAQIEALMGQSGFDGLLGSLADLRTYTQRQTDAAAAAEEQARRAPLTNMFATFEQTIQDIRSTFENAFIDSGVLDFIGGELGEGGHNLLGFFQNMADSLKDYLGSPQFKKDFQMVKEKVQGFKDAIGDFVDDIREFGFIGALKQAFGMDAGQSFGSVIMDSLLDGFLPSLDTLIVGFASAIGAFIFAAGATLLAPISLPIIAIGAAIAGIAAMFGWEAIKDAASAAWDGMVGVFTGIGDWFGSIDWLAPITGTWNAITGMFTGIVDWFGTVDIMAPLKSMWDTVTGWFSFGGGDGGEGTSFSISALGTAAWEVVKGWFSLQAGIVTGLADLAIGAWNTVLGWFGFDGINFSISQLATDAWESVTGFFSFGDSTFSISQLASDAWESVTGFFSFGDSTFSISKLATDAWESVTGFFSFGGGGEEGGTSFSITSLMTDAWASVTSFFSLENFSIPSISEMFTGIIDAVKGFFSFDFKMPNFRQFLPTWLGGEGKSLSDSGSTSAAVEPPDTTPAVEGGEAVGDAQTAIAQFASLPDLQNNLDILKQGLDVEGVRSYTLAMEQLVNVLDRLNETLSEDNMNILGNGTGVAASDVLGQISTASQGSAQGTQQLNSIMTELLAVMTEVRDFDEKIEQNTKRNTGGTNIASGSISTRA